MKTWLLSVTATVLLFILLEILLAEGSTKKYVQGFLRLILVIVLLSPIIKIAKNEDYIDYFFSIRTTQTSDSEPNSTHAASDVNSIIIDQIKNKIEKKLLGESIDGNVEIDADNTSIRSITVTVKNTGIKTNENNIHTIANIKQTVREIVDVDEDKIFVYGTT